MISNWWHNTFAASAALLLCGLLAYSNTLHVPFVFDDETAIVKNPTLRNLDDWRNILTPPSAAGVTVGGRPVLNATFALNYAIHGDRVEGYHAFNLGVHLGAGLLLFGLLRRTLRQLGSMPPGTAVPISSRPAMSRLARPPATYDADALALAVAILWVLHPLQTESVTYLAQRAESLMGFFYLLTLYCFVRSVGSHHPRWWRVASVAACTLGMGTKEVMASAPLIALLMDRAFWAGSFRAAWHTRRVYYSALASSWLLLGVLVLGSHARGGTAGFGKMSSWSYALTQCRALIHYLALTAWPHPLVFDYGTPLVSGITEVGWEVAGIVVLVVATAVALVRRTTVGFLLGGFFVILTPTSSILPVATQTMAEHRLYLPLAALIALTIGAGYAWLGRRFWPLVAVAMLACGGLTFSRNAVYRTDVGLWMDTIAGAPQNARAYYQLGNAWISRARYDAAVESYRGGLRITPNYVEAHNNLAAALDLAHRPTEAAAEYETALHLHPIAETHYSYAVLLEQSGRTDLALQHYGAALALRPDFPEALNNRGNLLLNQGQMAASLVDYEAALRLAPRYVEAHLNLATALLGCHQPAAALEHALIARQLKPEDGIAEWKIGDALLDLGRRREAIEHLRHSLHLDPSLVFAEHDLARALTEVGQPADALPHYERALQMNPSWSAAHHNAALALAALDRVAEAIAHEETALRLQPDFPAAAINLADLKHRASLREAKR